MSRGRENIEYLLSLFEIKPLSDCVETEEITSGFAQCSSGQTFLHLVVPSIQRYLFHCYPKVYQEVKEKKVAFLKKLMFTQVGTTKQHDYFIFIYFYLMYSMYLVPRLCPSTAGSSSQPDSYTSVCPLLFLTM